jgi:hypothetical protein
MGVLLGHSDRMSIPAVGPLLHGIWSRREGQCKCEGESICELNWGCVMGQHKRVQGRRVSCFWRGARPEMAAVKYLSCKHKWHKSITFHILNYLIPKPRLTTSNAKSTNVCVYVRGVGGCYLTCFSQYLGQWYSTFVSSRTTDQSVFNFVPPKLSVYNSSYTQSIIYI